jgi:hypothetical protein
VPLWAEEQPPTVAPPPMAMPANEEVTEAYITKNSSKSSMQPEHEKFLDPLQL